MSASLRNALPPERTSPYQGLTPFTPDDTDYFFGREQDTEIITANLIAERLTLLYGPSGVGKSSVLGAGVVHHLRERAKREIARGDPPEYLVVFFNDWRNEPVATLLQEIANALTPFVKTPPPPTTLVETLRAWNKATGAELILILDQFEEFFLYHQNDEGDRSFAAQFSSALKDPEVPANFLLSFREDALAKLDLFKKRIPNLYKNYLRVKHLDAQAARRAILKPLEKYNELHPAAPPVTIEPALVDAILIQVQVGNVVLGETGRGTLSQDHRAAAIETPYLQLVLTRLWTFERERGSNRLQLTSFINALGGAEKIVRGHLDTAINELSEPQRAIAANIFDHLVTPSGTKIAQTEQDLAEYAKVSYKELKAVLEQLARGDNRILRPVAGPLENPDVPRYEIFHDVLASAILEWRAGYEKERDQKQQSAELEAKRAAAEAKAAEQERARRDAEARSVAEERARREAEARTQAEARARVAAEQEAHAAKRLRAAAIVLVVVAALAILAAGCGVIEWSSANQAAGLAQTAVVRSNTGEARAIQEADNAKNSEAKANSAATGESQSKQQSESRRLVAQSLVNRTGNFWLSFLLAIEAAKSGYTPETQNNLKDLLTAVSHLRKVLWGHTDAVSGVVISPDGKLLASAGADTTIRLWDVQSGKQIGQLRADDKAVTSLAFRSDGSTLVSGSADGKLRTWDMGDAAHLKLLGELAGHNGAVYALAFSPDGKTLASAGADKTIRLWDPSDAAHLKPLGEPLTGHEQSVFSIVFSPGGKLLASAGADQTVRLWNVTTQQSFGEPFTGHTGLIWSIAFSPDGKTLASASADQTIRFWDVASRQLLVSLPSVTEVRAIAFSPDRKTFAAAYADRTIQFYDLGSRQTIGNPLRGNTDLVTTLAFSPDGSSLASGSRDGLVMIWDTNQSTNRWQGEMQSWIDPACVIVNRNPARAEWEEFFKSGDATFENYVTNPTCRNLPVSIITPTAIAPTAARTRVIPETQVVLMPTATPTSTGVSTPTLAPSTGTPGATFAPVTGIVKEVLNVREEPNKASKKIGKLKKDDVIGIVGRNDDSAWLNILYPRGATTRGWVSTEFIETSADLALVPVSGATPSATFVAIVTATTVPTRTATKPRPTPTSGFPTQRAQDGAVMILIPAGEFPMGSSPSDPATQNDQIPIHTVFLDAFWIDREEVTNGQFRKFVAETGYKTEAEKLGWGWVVYPDWVKRNGASWHSPEGPGANVDARLDHPVVQVSWNDARAYCNWAGKRLPTEAEWEKAARGSDGRLYPWGNTFDSRRANTNNGGNGTTLPVGSYPSGVSPYGVLDMAGNVWEWVNDFYGEHYYRDSPSKNPQGPEQGQNHVLRGGAWIDNEVLARAPYRLQLEPFYSGIAVGFRCARPQ